jgi:UDP-N-acetylglucosamine 2-epimerase
MLKLALVVPARPSFMKVAPILSELNRYPKEALHKFAL